MSSRTTAAVRPALVGRTARLLLALLLACGVVLTSALLGTRPAYAATGDQIDGYQITYDVRPTGVVRVTETIKYRFGTSSGRHGIDRLLVTREQYDDQQDAVYTVDNIDVSTPDPTVSGAWQRTDSESQGGRQVTSRIRIGDADTTVPTPTATYVIAYDLTGALRTFPTAQPAYDEFYWDATGSDWQASIQQVEIEVTVPGGVLETTCTYGPVGSTSTCGQKIDKGVATFTQRGLAPGEGATIGNKIGAGLVSDNAPHLEPDASRLSAGEKAGIFGIVGVGAAALVGAPLVGVAYWRRHGRDQRWEGMAPGSFPPPGVEPPIVPNDPDIPIPVAFVPPRIPVAEAGVLVDGQVDTRDTAATIIDLAVRGALTVQSEDKNDFRVTLVDPSRATAPHEMVLLNDIFTGRPPGTQVDLSSPGSMSSAHDKMKEAVRDQVAGRGWFTQVPSGRATRAGFGIIGVVVLVSFALGAWALLLAIPLLPILITVAVVRSKMRRGQRTPAGRAVCDQVEGFKTYLSTAEADQLRFEEGEDIFSRYLPWAIAFDLAERWAKVCADLVALGRVPNSTPGWYYGNGSIGSFNTGFLTGSLLSSAAPAPPPPASSSGTGFGGGSSFSGGGFSGGGGGGGGGGSW